MCNSIANLRKIMVCGDLSGDSAVAGLLTVLATLGLNQGSAQTTLTIALSGKRRLLVLVAS